MPAPIDLLSGVSGQDGIVPVYDPNSRWQLWRLKDIFTGVQGANRYVPKVEDWILDTDTSVYYRVTHIDYTTGLTTKVPVDPVEVGVASELDRMVIPGSDTYFAYLDKSVTPYRLTLDQRALIPGSMCSFCRIYKGSNTGPDGEIISAYYDAQGNILSQNIPLEIIAVPNSPENGVSVISLDGDLTTLQDMQNFSIKTVPSCYTTHNLGNGELVTMVAYSDNGFVASMQQFRIVNTSFIRATELGTKYVTNIRVESPFISNSEPDTIRFPLNVPLEGLSLIGVVSYSDGTELHLPVDNTKFSIWGFEKFVSTIVGQEFPLVLSYKLSNGEAVAGSTNVGHGEGITYEMRGIALNKDASYTNKLFCYPVWINEVSGYRLEWFLYSLERSAGVRVTNHVRINANSAGFNPTLYGVNQQLSVSITLRDVNGSLPAYIHTQTVGITLIAPATVRSTNWKMEFAPNQNPMYGIDVHANSVMVNSNLWKLRLDSGFSNLSNWLNALYYNSLPLVDTTKETRPPEPNFFKVVINEIETELPIAQWNGVHQFSTAIPDGSTVFIKFFRRVADNDIQLAVAGLPVYQGPDEPDVVVVPPAPIQISLNTTNLSVTRSSASLGSGQVLANVSGGTAPYSFSWVRTSGNRSSISNASVANPTISANLLVGDNFIERWTVTVTDALNTVASTYVDVRFRVILPMTGAITPANSVAPISAPGIASKQLTAVPINGSAPYTYSWSRTQGSHGTANDVSNAAPIISANVLVGEDFTETWSCVITDSVGNQITETTTVRFLVTDTLAIAIAPNSINETRTGAGLVSAVATAGVTGGYGPFSYQWTRMTGTRSNVNDVSSAAPVISATLTAGSTLTETWRVVVTDATNATAMDTVDVTFTADGVPDPIVITFTPNPFVVDTIDPNPPQS